MSNEPSLQMDLCPVVPVPAEKQLLGNPNDDIVKVSALGSAGFTSLVNRRIDGEDVVRMTRVMKGSPRDEFIGYVEILSMNGQIMCNCGKTAKVKTDSDGMKTMVGIECITQIPCVFVIGRLGKSRSKTSSASKQPKSAANTPQASCPASNPSSSIKPATNSSKPPHPKLAATKSVSATPQPSASSKTTRKDPKPPLPDSMAWSRPPPSAIVTKTGLYLTMPDPSTRNPPHIDPPKSRKPYKPRTKVPTPAGAEIPKASSSTTQSSSFSAAPQCDFNSLNYIHSFEAKMFEMGLTSFDQLFSATSTNLNNKSVTDYTAIDALDLDRFFNENTSIGAPLSQPTITPSHSNDFIEIIGQPTDLMGYLNSTMMDITSPFSQTSFSETMVQYPSGTHSYSSSFLPSTSEPSISRQNSYLFADAFGSESMATATSAADLFSGDSLLDTMMTNWDLESLDGSVLSQPVDSLSNGDVNSIFRPQVFSSQHQPLFTQSLVSAWLPNLPDKNFPEVGLSSSLSSVSSLATSCSTMSNASDLLANKPQSRKRQYHSTSSNLPQPAPTDKTSDMALKKGSVPSTSRSSRPPTTTAKVNAPKLHPPPSTPRSTNIPTTLPRTRPLMTASSRPPSASVTKTAFGSSIHSTTSRTPATRPASRLQPQELSVRGRSNGGRNAVTTASTGLPVGSVVRLSDTTTRNVRAKTPSLVTPTSTAVSAAAPPMTVSPIPIPPTRIPTPVSCLSSMIQQHQQSQQSTAQSGPTTLNDVDQLMADVFEEGPVTHVPLPSSPGKAVNTDMMFDSLFDFSMDIDRVMEGVNPPAVAAVAEGPIADNTRINLLCDDWLL